jgi:Na+/H+ antiporter NhaC
MLPAIVTLMLAWTFGHILSAELHTGEYLANILISSVSIVLLPSLLFITATLIAFIIGTAWGTATMLFPIAIPMVPAILGMHHVPTLAEIPILLPVLGGILSGCVAGNHISPIADTTIMSATSTRTPIMEHVRTQLPYAIPIIIVTALGFLLSAVLIPYGLLIASVIPIAASVLLSIITMHVLQLLDNKIR